MVVTASRLVTAREAKGLSKAASAKLLNISAQAIKDYEGGITNPTPKRVSEMAEIYGFEPGFFYREDIPAIAEGAITFRSRRSLRVSVRDRAIARSKIASHDLAGFLMDTFALPEVDIPELSHLSPEDAASTLRRHWGLGYGPIDNMVHLLEAKGVFVFWLSEDSKAVDAFTYRLHERPFIFLNTFKGSGERGRLDAAHELGHLVLHSEIDAERTDSKEIEDEANAFASAFLMPAEQFRMEAPRIHSLHAFLRLKPRWKTSVQAMVRRARDLGLLTQWHYETAYKQMSGLGWRSGPEEGALPREGSHIHFSVFDFLSSDDFYSDDLAVELGLKFETLVELMPVAHSFQRERVQIQQGLRLLTD